MFKKTTAFLVSFVIILGCAVGALVPPLSRAGEALTIAAASGLNFAFTEVTAEFEKKTGTPVKLSFGSSGNLFSQIQNGASFDMYFSSDIGYPHKLEQNGHVVPGTLYRYAVGRLVVWVPASSRVPIEQRGIEALLEPSVRKIAIANPKHAPYGKAAVSAMEHYRIYDRVKDKLVLGESVSQTAQYVESGASDIGIIALALALAPSMKSAGKYWEIPAEAHAPIEQGAVILKKGTNTDAARTFLEFLKSDQGRDLMNRYGFVLPDAVNGAR